jgi:hypothetical protein
MSYETEKIKIQTLQPVLKSNNELGNKVQITVEPFDFVTFKPMGMVDSDDSGDLEDSPPEEVSPEL